VSPTSSCSFEPVDREVGDRGGGVVGDEMRCVVDVAELDAIGVALGIAGARTRGGRGVARRGGRARVDPCAGR